MPKEMKDYSTFKLLAWKSSIPTQGLDAETFLRSGKAYFHGVCIQVNAKITKPLYNAALEAVSFPRARKVVNPKLSEWMKETVVIGIARSSRTYLHCEEHIFLLNIRLSSLAYRIRE